MFITEAGEVLESLRSSEHVTKEDVEALKLAMKAIADDVYDSSDIYKFTVDTNEKTHCSFCGAGGPVVRILYTKSTRYPDKSGSSVQEEIKMCHYCRRKWLNTLKRAWRV